MITANDIKSTWGKIANLEDKMNTIEKKKKSFLFFLSFYFLYRYEYRYNSCHNS